MDPERREQLENTAIGLAVLPALLKGLVLLLVLGIGVAILLGKIGLMLGAIGMAGAIALAVGAALVERQKLKKAMRDSEQP